MIINDDKNVPVTVGTTSKAGLVTPVDSLGDYVGQKYTYSACSTIKWTGGGNQINLTFYGEDGYIIRVQRLVVTAKSSAASNQYHDLKVGLRLARPTGGTVNVALTAVPHNVESPPSVATFITQWTTGPTSVGVLTPNGALIGCSQQFEALSVNGVGYWDYDWRLRSEAQCPILNSSLQGLEVSFGATTNAPTTMYWITWTEQKL